MKRILVAALVAASTAPALTLAADVGVTISVGQPGYYGRIDIVDFPPPRLIYPQPVVLEPVPAGVVVQPIYLVVPSAQAKNWRKHCRRYDACGQPVYFVSETWYGDVYVKRKGRGHDKAQDKGQGKKQKKD